MRANRGAAGAVTSMRSRSAIWVGIFIGSTIGSLVPGFWGEDVFSSAGGGARPNRSKRHRPGLAIAGSHPLFALWHGDYRPPRSGVGNDLGSHLLGQFNRERSDLL